ncbi:SRPBCC domain-containing protein [Weeksellaceae bacterium A-14]
METLSYNIVIRAPKQKIWDILWAPETYTKWTQYFSEQPTIIKSDWKVGGRTLFVDHNNNGMVATISNLDEPNEVTFNHLGIVENGEDDIESEKIKQWSGAPERYSLILLDDGSVKLHVEIQIDPEYREVMDRGFTNGLQTIKKLAEEKEFPV